MSVEYHGWATLCNSTNDDFDADRTAEIAQTVQGRIKELHHDHAVLGLKVVNATQLLWCAGRTNHHGQQVEEIFELMRYVASHAPGSYGLLYVWDDENVPHDNEFRVWRLARGGLTECTDPFLSPCRPTIEDWIEAGQ